MSVSQSLMSPWVQPLTNIWLQGEKQQATTLASLAGLHLETTDSRTLEKNAAQAVAEQVPLEKKVGNYSGRINT